MYWLDPWAWDKELELVPLHEQPEPVDLWLDLIRAQGWRVMLLPYDARIEGGPCDGGHVVAVETGEGRRFAALPPGAIPEAGAGAPARRLPGPAAGHPRPRGLARVRAEGGPPPWPLRSRGRSRPSIPTRPRAGPGGAARRARSPP